MFFFRLLYFIVCCILTCRLGQAVGKAQNNLAKTEKKEESTLKAANKAAHKHDLAVTELHKAENDLRVNKQFFVFSSFTRSSLAPNFVREQLKQQQQERVHHGLGVMKAQADEAQRQKEAHEVCTVF